MEETKVLEPLGFYNSVLKERVEQNVNDCFNDLLEKSGIDCNANRATVRKYNAKQTEVKNLQVKISRWTIFRNVLVGAIIVGLVLALYGFGLFDQLNILVGVIGACISLLSIVLIFCVANKVINNSSELTEKLKKQINGLMSLAKKQVAPLFSLFDDRITKELVEKSFSGIKLDDSFNLDRMCNLSKYGLKENFGTKESVLETLSGELYGQSFAFVKKIKHNMGTKEYFGSIVIQWVETEKRGKDTVSVTKTQTLVASVQKPCPNYSAVTKLFYGNDSVPDLKFSRVASFINQFDKKEIEKKVKVGAKELRKKALKATKNGGTFTEMANEEFDVLFGASNRNNEIQFRMMFTPLAQRNIVALLKSNIGYGDDFSWKKLGKMNIVESKHAQKWEMSPTIYRYDSYSFDKIKFNFINYNNYFFKSIYFDFAPILSIPIYTQQNPIKDELKEDYGRNYTNFEWEILLNCLRNYITSKESNTDSIIKAEFSHKVGKTDVVHTVASGYKACERIDYIPVSGGDGYVHQVPVPWLEYISVKEENMVAVRKIGLSEREFYLEKENILNKVLNLCTAWAYNQGFFAIVLTDSSKAYEFDELLKDYM